MTTVDSIIPAKPNQIRAVANFFKTKGSDLESISISVKDLPGITPTWVGDAASAFDTKAAELSGNITTQADIYASADTFLHAVADVFAEYRSIAADLIAQLEEFKDSPEDITLIEQDINELREAGKRVADHSATELLGILDGYSETATPEGGPESGDQELQPVNLSREENLKLFALLQTEGAIGDNELMQGGIGNCYLLANIIAMMNSEEGSDFLRDSIRPIFSDKDGEIIGWEVRVYDDDVWWNPFDKDPEVWQTVTQRYADPSKGKDQPATLAWLLERAYGQMFGHHDSGHGGYRDEAVENLLGTDAKRIEGSAGDGWFDSGDYSTRERNQIVNAIEDGRPVTTGTGSAPKDTPYWIEYKSGDDVYYESYMPVELGGQGGQQANIKIYGAHAYAVVDADENGLTLVNPHGSNNVQNQGTYTDSGKFYVTWEEFEHRFGDVAVGGEYRK